MANITEAIVEAEIVATSEFVQATNEFVGLVRRYGANMVNDLNALISEANLDPEYKVRLVREMSTTFDSLPLTPENSTMVNSMISGTGIITAGYSAIRFNLTTSFAAKKFYAVSIGFSSGAAVTGGIAVMTRMCKVSEVAFVSEVMGAAFLCLGEMAHAQALKVEGKPIPPHLQKWAKARLGFRRSFDNNQNLSFVMPGNFHGMSDIIGCIPFEKIGKIVGVGLTAYGYYKIVVMSYRYSQKLITKWKEHRLKKDRSTLLHNQINFLAISICNSLSVRTRLLIYYQLKVS